MFEPFVKNVKLVDLAKKKQEDFDISSKIKRSEGQIILETKFTETIPLFSYMEDFHMSYDNSLTLFSPINHDLIVWDITNAEGVEIYHQGPNFIHSCAKFVPNTHNVVAVFSRRNVWKDKNEVFITKFYILQTIDKKHKVINQIGFELSPDDDIGFITENADRIFTFSEISGLIAWDTDTGEKIDVTKRSQFFGTKLITADCSGDRILCLRQDVVEIWNYIKSELLNSFKIHVPNFSTFCVDRNFTKIAYENNKGEYELWDIASNNQIALFPIKEILETENKKKQLNLFRNQEKCEFSSDGKLFAFHGQDGSIYVCDIINKKVLKRLLSPGKSLSCLGFSPDSRRLLFVVYRQDSYIIDIL